MHFFLHKIFSVSHVTLSSTELPYKNHHQHPEDVPFRTWLQRDPHFFRIAREDIHSVRRVIKVLGHPTIFANVDPNFPLNHDYRLALTIRYISERYKSSDEIFDLFGVNRKTLYTYNMTANEPKATQYYAKLYEALSEMTRRRKQSTQRREEKLREEAPEIALAEVVPIEAVPIEVT